MKHAVLGVLLLAGIVSGQYQLLIPLRIPFRISPSSSCGARKVTTRNLIVGANESSPGAWPWHAAVYYVKGLKRDYRCGGTLIKPNYVLTTASCARYGRNKPEGAVQVVLGQHSLVESSMNSVEVPVKEVFIHEEYLVGENMYDIGLLKLKNSVKYTNYIQPACLPKSTDKISEIDTDEGYIIGWGYDESGKLTNKLQQAKVPIIPILECLRSDRDFFGANLYRGMYCAGLKNGTAPCFGDAGGGMFFPMEQGWTLRGIVSFTDRTNTDIGACNTQQYFGVTNVFHFLSWIESITGNRVPTATTATTTRE